jgi:hypothetical protein
MGFLSSFLSSIFLSACLLRLQLCRAAFFVLFLRLILGPEKQYSPGGCVSLTGILLCLIP